MTGKYVHRLPRSMPVDQARALSDVFQDLSRDATQFQLAADGAVARSTADKLGEVVSVKDFGAVGDNVANDTAALQAAIDAAEAISVSTGRGVGVYIPGGIYRFTALTIKQGGVSLIGDGPGTSILRKTTTTGDGILISNAASLSAFANWVRDNYIRDLQIDTTAENTAGRLVHFQRCLNFGMHNCRVFDGYQNIVVTGGAWGFFSSINSQIGNYLSAFRSGSACFMLRTVAVTGSPFGNGRDRPASIFLNNFECSGIFNNGRLDYGIFVGGCDGFYMANGHCGFSKTAACVLAPLDPSDYLISVNATNVYFDGADQSCDNALYIVDGGAHTGPLGKHNFTGCEFALAASTGTGLRLSSPGLSECSFSGCDIVDNYGLGCLIEGGRGISFSGCSFDTSNRSDVSQGNITIQGSATDISIVGGQISGPGVGALPSWGINLAGTCNRITVKGVSFFRNATDVVRTTTGNDLDIADNMTDKTNDVASASSLDIPYIGRVFNVTGTTGITTIPNTRAWKNREVTLIFGGALTVTDGSNLSLAGNLNTSTGTTLSLVWLTNWFETRRSIN